MRLFMSAVLALAGTACVIENHDLCPETLAELTSDRTGAPSNETCRMEMCRENPDLPGCADAGGTTGGSADASGDGSALCCMDADTHEDSGDASTIDMDADAQKQKDGGGGPGECQVCADEAPYCSDRGECVACLQRSHCGPEGVCTAEHACVACEGNDDCPPGTPVCDTSGEQARCVQCTAEDATACGEGKPVCDVEAGTCVECVADADCTDPSAAKCDVESNECVPCDDSEQCEGIAGTEVCEPTSGQCVECTRNEREACQDGGTSYVCHPQDFTCELDRPVQSKTDCNKCALAASACGDLPAGCVSDDECQPGQACVDVAAGGGERVCLKVFAEQGDCGRPYLDVSDSVTSADGEDVTVCTFRAATTCQAHAHYSNKPCGKPDPENPGSELPDNSECGVEEEDGYCVLLPGPGDYLCTVPCKSNVGDCPEDSGSCLDTSHGSGSRNLCTL